MYFSVFGRCTLSDESPDLGEIPIYLSPKRSGIVRGLPENLHLYIMSVDLYVGVTLNSNLYSSQLHHIGFFTV